VQELVVSWGRPGAAPCLGGDRSLGSCLPGAVSQRAGDGTLVVCGWQAVAGDRAVAPGGLQHPKPSK